MSKVTIDRWADFIDTLYPDLPDRGERARDQKELLHATLGLAGETGEVVDIIKKVWAYDKKLDKEKLIEEMGDLFHYYTRLLHLSNIKLSEVIDSNYTKLKKRYPNGYTHDAAIKQGDKQNG
ncbi:MAG: nucleotide pyrophosphohydrolase [Burkholderiales bacterium]|nr:MAG: nucleotide pyrophosphohydrolase [Burkholderiales bacterium]